jgi:hypothetical protein
VYVVVRSSHSDDVRQEKLQRITAMSVSALLAANALVIAVGLGDDLASSPAADQSETVTFIVGEDGTRVAVDPNTPEGWRAIADAQERGQEVVSEPVADPTAGRKPSTTTTTRPKPRPGQVQPSGSAITVPDVEQVLDDTLNTVVSIVDDVGQTVDDTVDQVTDIVDDTTGLDSGETVDPAVDEATDTLTTTVSTVVETVTDATLPPVTVPPVTTPPVTTPPLPGL